MQGLAPSVPSGDGMNASLPTPISNPGLASEASHTLALGHCAPGLIPRGDSYSHEPGIALWLEA